MPEEAVDKEEEKRQVTAYIEATYVDQIDALAKARKWTRSVAIAHLIEIGCAVIAAGQEKKYAQP